MSTTSTRSNGSSDITHTSIWGEQIAALQTFEAEVASGSIPPEEHGQRPSTPEGIASTPGTTAMFVPPVGIDAFSNSYLGDSDLYPISSFEEAPDHLMRRKPSSESPATEIISVKPGPTRSLSSAAFSLMLSDPEKVQPLNVPGHTDEAPPIPRRATKHTVPVQPVTTANAATSARASLDNFTPVQTAALEITDPTAKEGLDAAGFDVSSTTDTHLHTKYAPVETKGVVKPTMHEIRQERTTREIHHHDIFHSILPIMGAEVLPARHFLRSSNGNVKGVSAGAIPGRAETSLTVDNAMDYEEVTLALRKFTASTLEGFPQDYEERLGTDPVRSSHTTWIHSPPMLLEGDKDKGIDDAI